MSIRKMLFIKIEMFIKYIGIDCRNGSIELQIQRQRDKGEDFELCVLFCVILSFGFYMDKYNLYVYVQIYIRYVYIQIYRDICCDDLYMFGLGSDII